MKKKLKGGPFGDMKNFPKIFLNSVTVPKNVKGGTLCDFLTSIVLQNIETNEGGPFGPIQKLSKSHSTHWAKKSGAMGGSLVCFVFSFRFGRASEVGVVEV